MPMEGIVVAIWSSGIVEGYSLLSHFQTETSSQPKSSSIPSMVVSSVLYGTMALPLSVIGASPGPFLLQKLPLPFPLAVDKPTSSLTKEDSQTPLSPPQPSSVAPSPPQPPISPQQPTSPLLSKQQSRAEKLRHENKNRLWLKRNSPVDATSSSSSSSITLSAEQVSANSFISSRFTSLTNSSSKSSLSQYIATLEQPSAALATPLAEAMRRMRFGLAGVGLALFLGGTYFSSLRKIEGDPNDESTRATVKKHTKKLKAPSNPPPGKDINAIEQLLSSTKTPKKGAVLRWCRSEQELSNVTATISQKITQHSTIPLLSLPFTGYYQNARTDTNTFWDVGRNRDEWSQIPISSEWLLQTSTDSHPWLVLEADLTPSTSNKQYLGSSSPPLDGMAQTVTFFQTLVDTALERQVVLLPSHAIHILLGCGNPSLPRSLTSPPYIYVDVQKQLGMQICQTLQNMHDDLIRESTITTTPVENTALQTPLNTQYGKLSWLDPFYWIDCVGFSIRQMAHLWMPMRTFDAALDGDSCPVVHVLSDHMEVIPFLQRYLHDWRIIRYDACSEDDVEQFYQHAGEGSLSIICCDKDITTSAFWDAFPSKDSARSLIILLEHSSLSFTHPKSVRICIEDFNNSIFFRIREVLDAGQEVDVIGLSTNINSGNDAGKEII